tara:strand:- start:141 stop:890 length:750 start_codon:yes stop_codon:yes gene_type:complete
MNGLYLLIPILSGIVGAIFTSWLVQEYDNYGKKYSHFSDIFTKRSQCDFCQKKLKFYELMPIFSFILQGGKSRCCNKNLRKKYIVFESLGALIFVVGALYSLINISILALLLIFLIFVDERYKEIALWNNLSLLLWVLHEATYRFKFNEIMANLIGAVSMTLVLVFIYFFYRAARKREGIGIGDIILLFTTFLYFGIPLSLYLLIAASLSLIVKIIVTRKYKDEHAFGSWIAGFFLIFTVFQEFYEIVG